MNADRFDAVIVGAGVGGEVAIGNLAGAGLRIAVVERELIGGECAYWACMPTKTLLRPPEARAESVRAAGVSTPALQWSRVSEYRDWMIRGLDDAKQVRRYQERGIEVVKGAAQLAGPGRVAVNGRTLETDRIVLATGSDPVVPRIDGLAVAGYWTNREATTMRRVPRSAVVIGGGPVGIELALILHRFGAKTTIIQSADRLIDREDPKVGELIQHALGEEGITVLTGRHATSARREQDGRVVVLEDGQEVRGEVIVIGAGRRPRLAGLGLDAVGLDGSAGRVPIDERCRAEEGIWAIGDLTGISLFTHVAKYHGRIASADILGESATADYRAIPRVVFSDPEIAAVGQTERRARAAGIDLASATIDLAEAIARPYTYEETPRGTLTLHADRTRQVLVGAWAVAPLASEWIHYAALAIRAEVPIGVLKDTVAQFPTYTEGFLSAVRRLDLGQQTT